MNRQPYTSPPKWWAPQMTPWWVRLTRGYRWRQLQRKQHITRIDVAGLEHVRQAVSSGAGVLITPNHSAHYDSAALYCAADRIDVPLYFMVAWQVFGMSGAFERWAMQRLGCFSIDRESVDRKAFKQAIDVLLGEPHPLVIFPEGDIYHISDRVTPFREGAMAIALSAARKNERPIVTIPCGIKFWYEGDPSEELAGALDDLEDRVLLRPLQNAPLYERVHRLAEGVLALKELDYLGHTRSGKIRERVQFLTEEVMSQIEKRHNLWRERQIGKTPERVKAVRQLIIRQFDQQEEEPARGNGKIEQERRRQFELDMEDLFFVMQLYSYPGDYVVEKPSIERLAETLDKFEEDVLQRDLPKVRGSRRVTIRFGEPIPIQPERGRDEVSRLTKVVQDKVQVQVDQLNE